MRTVNHIDEDKTIGGLNQKFLTRSYHCIHAQSERLEDSNKLIIPSGLYMYIKCIRRKNKSLNIEKNGSTRCFPLNTCRSFLRKAVVAGEGVGVEVYIAYFLVHSLASWLYLSLSDLNILAISGTRGSSGLGSQSSEHTDRRTLLMVSAGDH